MPPDLHAFQAGFAAAIAGPARGALRVYRNTIVRGSVEALRANYPVVAQIVGPDMFAALAADFAESSPPRSPVLALYGDGLAEWLEEQPWIADLPYLADVARVERLQGESLFAADAEPLALAALAGSDWRRLVLRLHPAARFAWTRTPAPSIWAAHRSGNPGPIAPEWKGEGLLFTRPGLSVEWLPLDSAGHRFLLNIAGGAAVAAAATRAARAGADPGVMFGALVNTGAFAAADPGGTGR